MVDISHLPLREELRGQRAYGAPQLDVPVALNTNENPYPPSPALVQSLLAEIQRLATRLNRYPDRDAVQLRADLADYVTRRTGVEVTGENVWAANGSNEILQQLLQAFGGPGRSVLGFQPSYSMHPILAAGTHTEFLNVPRRADFTVDIDAALAAIAEHQPSVLFITTPNNPTGTPTELNEIEQLCHAMHGVDGIVIVDEAYAEFSESPSATTLIAKYPATLVVSRTMSKAFDFAGVRLGYFVADPAFVEAVQLVRLPYHLSVLTQAAARAALRHADETLADVGKLIAGRHQVVAELQELGYTVMPSESNFVFFGDFADQHDIWQQFLDRGVLIRDVGVDGYLRATIGTPEENEAFVQAAREVQR
ncbi:histidinol-phosphate transaminase [Corynebacterium propinquum]|uniref:histidinol-phosphate transaminase n=1 Tax=Corynebacterium propinquum TaxID=43769 RepID=UPI002540FD2D|nr:histidinol-phosphate transaminase [Corynebacterium propinquum]MDK4235457.1 histidinol-phosphate transaminase [Corynebacterium propinquum]